MVTHGVLGGVGKVSGRDFKGTSQDSSRKVAGVFSGKLKKCTSERL